MHIAEARPMRVSGFRMSCRRGQGAVLPSIRYIDATSGMSRVIPERDDGLHSARADSE